MPANSDLSAALAATICRQVQQAAPPPRKKKRSTARQSILFSDTDERRITEVTAHVLQHLDERISVADVLRLALHGWNYRSVTLDDVTRLRNHDGRRKRA